MDIDDDIIKLKHLQFNIKIRKILDELKAQSPQGLADRLRQSIGQNEQKL